MTNKETDTNTEYAGTTCTSGNCIYGMMLIEMMIVMVVDDEDDAGLCLVGDLKSGEGEGKLLNQDTLSSTLQRTAL